MFVPDSLIDACESLGGVKALRVAQLVLVDCVLSGVCVLSNAQMADETGCGVRIVTDVVKGMERAGWISSKTNKLSVRSLTLTEKGETETRTALNGLFTKFKPLAKKADTPLQNNATPLAGNCEPPLQNSASPLAKNCNPPLQNNATPPCSISQAPLNASELKSGETSAEPENRDIDNIYINNININSIPEKESEERKNNFVTISKVLRLTADEIGEHVKNRNIPATAYAAFVEKHSGMDFPSVDVLKATVRDWWAKNKPKKVVDPAVSLDARKAAFEESLGAWLAKNPGKYPEDCVREFFEYWIEGFESGKKMRFEKEREFDFGRRLKYSYEKIYLVYGNGNNKNGKQSTGKFNAPAARGLAIVDPFATGGDGGQAGPESFSSDSYSAFTVVE